MTGRVEVYWNLRKNLFSVRSVTNGRVIFHTDSIALADSTFVVRPAGRLRVLRERRKNVHAMVRGLVAEFTLPKDLNGVRWVTYDPYKHETFVYTDDDAPATTAPLVLLATNEHGRPVVLSIPTERTP